MAYPLVRKIRRRAVTNLAAGSRAKTTGIAAPGGTMADMKIFNFIHVVFAGAFYRWALREIDPMHPDLPRILLRKRELAEKQNRIFA